MTHNRLQLRRLSSLALCLGAFAACIDPESAAAPSGTPAGTIDGTSFGSRALGGFTVTLPANSKGFNETASPVTAAFLFFSSAEGGASSCLANDAKPGSSQLGLSVLAKGEVLTPGSYAIVVGNEKLAPGRFEAGFGKLDAKCASPDAKDATSGTVTITAVTDTSVVGDMDLTFPGGSVKGAFSAPTCIKTFDGYKALKEPACK